MPDERPRSRRTALITGAAAGMGASFARALAREDYRLVLVDRNGERLQDTEHSLSVDCEVMTADLTVEEDVARVEARCREGVDLLVNGAGFGHPTGFLTTPVEAEIAMSRLHTEAVLRLTLAALPSMIEHGRGGVINIASVLGFFPSSTYSATKAWVINFSRSAAVKTRPDNVAVTALCPGFTRTEFHGSAGMNMTRIPRLLWMEADAVVAAALRDWRKRRTISIPGWQYKTIVFLGRILPLRLIDRILSYTGKRPMAIRSRILSGISPYAVCNVRRRFGHAPTWHVPEDRGDRSTALDGERGRGTGRIGRPGSAWRHFPCTVAPMDLTCPKCGASMRQYERNRVTVDQCTECRGIFLDRGELEHLLDAEASFNGQQGAPAAPQYREERRYDDRRYDDRRYDDRRRDDYYRKKKKRSIFSELFDD